MQRLIKLKDGRTVMIGNIAHFKELIEENLGDDAAGYFTDLINEKDDEYNEMKEELEYKIEDLKEDLSQAESTICRLKWERR